MTCPPAISRSVALARILCAGVIALSVPACTTLPAGVRTQVVAPGEEAVEIGTPARPNVTPMEAALACFAGTLASSRRTPPVIGVGDIKDYTGRYSINEGNVVTQGGALMLFSALGKLGGTVRIAERFDPAIAERELAYMDRRQLGNGAAQDVGGKKVPWLPYFGGSIQATDYYIVGGITEVNYNIASGGVELGVNNIGAKRRTYTQSVSLDLRIVDTRTLLVVDAVSVTKQFKGYEVGANTFRFFGFGLLDVNIGAKGQEPLQLGIRATIEEAAMRLVGRVTAVDPAPCLTRRTAEIQTQTSEQLFLQSIKARAAAAKAAPARPAGPVRSAAPAGPPAAPVTSAQPVAPAQPAAPVPAPAPRQALNAQAASGDSAAEIVQIAFEVGDATLGGSAQAALDRIASVAKRGPVNLLLVSRDSENLDPGQRGRLLDQRLQAVLAALANRGVPAGAVNVVWRPDRTDGAIYRTGPGLQLIARMRVNK